MNTRRSLLTFGALLVALVLFGSSSAFAQGSIDATTVMVETGTATGSIVATWTATGLAVGDMIEVEHRAVTAGQTANQGWMGRVELALTATKHTITGLDHTKNYHARVRVVLGSTGNPTDWTSSETSSDTDKAMAMPAAPEKPVRVASPAVTARDMMLDVEWLEPASELDITLYRVYYTPKGGTTMEKLVLAPSTSTTLTSLMNGTEYTIEVAAESAAGLGPKSRKVMATPMAGATPTPALPIFGAFALGAGLLAAGRARLRRREQRRLTR